jgi:undecaprenyl diphosphate synthase
MNFVMQSNCPPHAGLHVAIIMDGNGRWATHRGLPRTAGHRAGVDAVRRVIETAPELGISMLTLFAFSSDNWRRPGAEVNALMQLLRYYLSAELARMIENGVRLTVIGRRDRLPGYLKQRIAETERASASGTRLHLQVAVDYSSRQAIASQQTCADVDLLIRSGGEKRLSDFLLWESAYAELLFVDTLWPDFGADDLRAALADFHGRERRFGGLSGEQPPIAAE